MEVPQIVHRQSSGCPGGAPEMVVLIFMRSWGVFLERVTVRATVAAILKEKLTLKPTDEVDTAVWNPDTGRTPVRTNSDNASERLFSANSRAWGMPARMSARVWMSTRPCDEVQLVLPKAERTSKRRVLRTLDIQCLQQVIYARCPLRRRLQRPWTNAGFQTKG